MTELNKVNEHQVDIRSLSPEEREAHDKEQMRNSRITSDKKSKQFDLTPEPYKSNLPKMSDQYKDKKST